MPAKYKILAADKLADEGLDYIRSQPDAELTNKPGLSEDELAAIAGEYDGIIVRSGVQVTAKVMANPGRLKGVARAGVGVDNIDLEAATSKGILVMNSAEASTLTTAEHAFALMMALVRNVGQAYQTMNTGGWDRNKYKGTQLAGKTLGVVGLGRIGQAFAERAMAFDMNVLAFDPYINADTAMDGRVKMFAKFEDMIPKCDVLTFHVPLNDQTRGLLNDKTFALCKKGVYVVNAARGGVVAEDAIVPAVESGQAAGVALDVYSTEPLAEDSPLRNHPKILTTPHLGASTKEAQVAVSVDAAASLLTYLRGEGIHGAVNAGNIRMDLDATQACFVDMAERMAALLCPMISGGIAEVNFTLSGEKITAAAEMIERMGLVGLLKSHLDTPLNLINIKHIADQRGIHVKRTILEDERQSGPQLSIEVTGGKEVRKVVGRVYNDMRPRIVEINGYFMDIIPEGAMVLIQNEDRPGMVGIVGAAFGGGQINIADMAISRRDKTALMVLKVDAEPDDKLVGRLRDSAGILKVAVVKLAPVNSDNA